MTHDIVDLERQTGDLLGLIRQVETSRLDLVQQRLERLESYTPSDPGVKNLDERIAGLDAEIARLRERVRRTSLGAENESGIDTARLQLELQNLRDDVRNAVRAVG